MTVLELKKAYIKMSKKQNTPVKLSAAAKDVRSIEQLNRLFNEGTSQPRLIGSNGEEIFLPESVYQALRQVVSAMATGQAVSLIPEDCEMTTQEAAELLNVSRPYLIKLLEEGKIPFITVGKHRRIRSQDLMEYKKGRDSQRRKNLRELTNFLQSEGYYDYNIKDSDCEE